MLPEIDAYQRRKSKLSVIASASGSAAASASAAAPPKMTHNKFLFVALLNLTFSQTADYPWDTHGAGITIIPCMIRVWSVCHLSAWHWPYNTLASSLPQPLLDCAWYLHRHSLWAGMMGAWCCAVWAWHPSMTLVWRVPRKKANSSIT